MPASPIDRTTVSTSLYLIDASPYIFRAYFSIPPTMTDAAGAPVNAVYGYSHFLFDFLARTGAARVAVAFDESLTTCFRNEIYPAYKANRELPPPELEAQLKACQRVTKLLGLPVFVSDRYEADDLIGSLAQRMRGRNTQIIYVSPDKDFAQLIENDDRLWDFARDRQFDRDEIYEHFGVMPERFIDYQGLMGDAVDNIPGVPGIGAKTAARLVTGIGVLEEIYTDLRRVDNLNLRGQSRIKSLLNRHAESAYLSRDLARIATDAPLEYDNPSLQRTACSHDAIRECFSGMGFGKRLQDRARDFV